MFTTDCLIKQHEWYCATLGLLLVHCANLPLEARHTKVLGFGWPTVHSQLMHIAETEAWWIACAQGRRIDWPRDSDWWDFAECEIPDDLAERYMETQSITREFIKGHAPEELQKPLWVVFDKDNGVNVSPALMINHLITHGFHHKGQVVAMSRLLGFPPPETDLDSQIGITDFVN